jgi:glutamate-1-semialdehyde aminotransferase
MQLHLTAPPVRTPEDGARADGRLVKLMQLALANRGVFSSTRQLYVLPTVVTAADLDRFVAAFTEALTIAAQVPHSATPVL